MNRSEIEAKINLIDDGIAIQRRTLDALNKDKADLKAQLVALPKYEPKVGDVGIVHGEPCICIATIIEMWETISGAKFPDGKCVTPTGLNLADFAEAWDKTKPYWQNYDMQISLEHFCEACKWHSKAEVGK